MRSSPRSYGAGMAEGQGVPAHSSSRPCMKLEAEGSMGTACLARSSVARWPYLHGWGHVAAVRGTTHEQVAVHGRMILAVEQCGYIRKKEDARGLAACLNAFR